MRRSVLVASFALALLAGCTDPELDPAPQPLSEAPEFTQPREPKKSADPPPPIHERRLDTTPESGKQYIYMTDTATPTSAATTGTVNALTPK